MSFLGYGDRTNSNQAQSDNSHRVEEVVDDEDEADKEDWDKYEGIYGRSGRFARD